MRGSGVAAAAKEEIIWRKPNVIGRQSESRLCFGNCLQMKNVIMMHRIFPVTQQSKGSPDSLRTLTFRRFFSSAVPKMTKVIWLGLRSRKRTIIITTKQSQVLLYPWETNMKPAIACTIWLQFTPDYISVTAQIWLHKRLWINKFIFGLCQRLVKRENSEKNKRQQHLKLPQSDK